MRQTKITLGLTFCFLFFESTDTSNAGDESLEAVKEVIWTGTSKEVLSVLDQDLSRTAANEREQRILKYWSEFVPTEGDLVVPNLDRELARIATERGYFNAIKSDSGFFVRNGQDEDEARVEAVRTWILTNNRSLLRKLINNRLPDERVSALDLITIGAINTTFVDSQTGLQALEFWVELYRTSKNPAFRFIAVAKSMDSSPDFVAALSSESNEWGFATMASRKKAFEEFARDANGFIRDFSTEKLKVYSTIVTDMANKYSYSEFDIAGRFERNIQRPTSDIIPAFSPGSEETNDANHLTKPAIQTQKEDDAKWREWSLVISITISIGILLLWTVFFGRVR